MTAAPDRDDLPTLIAIGVLAAMAASMSHELVGHGLACLATGGQVRLVSTVFFRCDGASAVSDLGGPLGNLAWALLALTLTASRVVAHRTGRLFLLTTAAFSLFWFFGQLGVSLAGGRNDWIFAAADARWPSVWPVVAVVVAFAGYDLTRRGLTRAMRTLSAGEGAGADRRRFLSPWLAGTVAMMGAAMLFGEDRIGGLKDATLGFGVAGLGIPLACALASRFGGTGQDIGGWGRRPAWIVAAGIGFIVFCLTMGLGIGSGGL